jgi:hypothetical protein
MGPEEFFANDASSGKQVLGLKISSAVVFTQLLKRIQCNAASRLLSHPKPVTMVSYAFGNPSRIKRKGIWLPEPSGTLLMAAT